MSLASGTKLGPYEIVSPLGAGGMGEVYRARDTRLDRDVAVKVLPARLAGDPLFKQRFEREARTVSSLNHPHICTLYDIGREGETDFLVMEYLEGETLAERLKRGPLPLAELVRIGMQISDALDKAHRKGVVHRDLKPANIMLTKGGAKLMDFGLAKPMGIGGAGSASAPLLSAAVTADGASPGSPLTSAGTLVGTIQYMSPEQVEGKEADARSDIFALGSTLYEMATGERAFQGKSQISVASAILEKDPEPIISKQPLAPVSLDRVVGQCLAKEPDERFQNAHDVGLELKWVGAAPAEGQSSTAGESARQVSPLRRALPWAIAGLLAITLIAVIALWKFAAPALRRSPVLSYIPPPPGTTFRDFGFSPGAVAVSPDGKQLAFSATDENGVTKLYVRPLASKEANAIAGTEDAAGLFWSPDGGSLGFFADRKLKTVNLANGNVQILADASCNLDGGGAWSENGTILFPPSCTGPLDKIPSSGGKPSFATKLQSGGIGHVSPAFLPGGQHFLYVSGSPYFRAGPSSIWMGSLGSNEQKLVLKNAGSPQFASGNLLFLRDGRVFAQAFDPSTGKLSGEARALAEAQAFSVSGTGVLAYQGGTLDGRMEWFGRSGNSLGSVGPVAQYMAARISPDGRRILADVADPRSNSSDLWSYPATDGPGTRLTFSPGLKGFSVWSPDGKHITYDARESFGKCEIRRKHADGSGTTETLVAFVAGARGAWVVDWSPDGRYISFDEYVAKVSRYEHWILPLFGDRKPFRVAKVDAAQFDGLFSPDGRWLAYFSYETGRPEVYVVPFPGPGGKFQISQHGGWLPRWDRKGHLYFLTMGNRLMEAELATSRKSLQVKTIHPLFRLSLPSIAEPFFDVNADGSRFLVITSTDPNAAKSIGLLLNWQAKLKGKE